MCQPAIIRVCSVYSAPFVRLFNGKRWYTGCSRVRINTVFMAQKLGSLFFSTARNLMRLQRSAFRLSKPLPIPRKKKTTKTIAKKVLVKQPPGLGTGVWRRNTYKRDPSNTELL